jgi:hypothetical protein
MAAMNITCSSEGGRRIVKKAKIYINLWNHLGNNVHKADLEENVAWKILLLTLKKY